MTVLAVVSVRKGPIMKSLLAVLTACVLTFSANAEACGCKDHGGTCDKCEQGCECDKDKCTCKDCKCPHCHPAPGHDHQHPEKK